MFVVTRYTTKIRSSSNNFKGGNINESKRNTSRCNFSIKESY